MVIPIFFRTFATQLNQKEIKDMKPWKVTMNGCSVKDYKTKNGAMKRGRLLRAHTPKDVDICVVSGAEYIEL